MITEAMIASLIVCAEPRIPFRRFFEQTKGYALTRPPNAYLQQSYVLDIGDAMADYAEYTERRREQCERAK